MKVSRWRWLRVCSVATWWPSRQRDSGNLGLTDEEQLAYATAQQMAIFTHDADFLHLAYGWAESGDDHWGIIYVHQDRVTIGECIHRLKEIGDLFDPEDLRNHIEFL